MQIVLDRTTTIRASVFEVERTLVIAILLVVLVVFLFLRNGMRATDTGGGGARIARRHLRCDVSAAVTASTIFR